MAKSDGGDAHTGASSVGAPHLVFVHGFLDDPSIWDATVSHLGFGPDTVTRVDLVGPDADSGRASIVERLAAEVVDVIEKRDGPVVLVGQSMGCLKSLQASERQLDLDVRTCGQLKHPAVEKVRYVDVASTTDRHRAGAIQAGKGQLNLSVRPRHHFHHPAVGVRDIHIASGIHGHP